VPPTTPRNGQFLHYLLATNQINASATGASGGGADCRAARSRGTTSTLSLVGASASAPSTRIGTLTLETQWTKTISCAVRHRLQGFRQPPVQRRHALDAGAERGRQLHGRLGGRRHRWSAGAGEHPARENVSGPLLGRFRKRIFGGRAKSQSIIGADYTRINSAFIGYGYYRADADWNVIVNPATLAVNNGRTVIGPVLWPMGTAPPAYAAWKPGTGRVALAGRQLRAHATESLDRLGGHAGESARVTLGGGNDNIVRTVSKGI